MSGRLSLAVLLRLAFDALDGEEWTTATELGCVLGLDHGTDHYRLSLVLERLANDGYAVLKTPGSTVRRFRRREP